MQVKSYQKPSFNMPITAEQSSCLFVKWLQSPSYSLHKNPCQKNLDVWPSLEGGSCGVCCSSVWLMIGPCSLWSMTGPQWPSPIATTQMWQPDQLADTGQGESRTDGRPLSRVSAAKQNQTNYLRICFRFSSLLILQVWPSSGTFNRPFSIYVLTLAFFMLPCCSEPQVLQG